MPQREIRRIAAEHLRAAAAILRNEAAACTAPTEKRACAGTEAGTEPRVVIDLSKLRRLVKP